MSQERLMSHLDDLLYMLKVESDKIISHHEIISAKREVLLELKRRITEDKSCLTK